MRSRNGATPPPPIKLALMGCRGGCRGSLAGCGAEPGSRASRGRSGLVGSARRPVALSASTARGR